MRLHKWTEEDLRLLEMNITKCGVKKGCAMTAKKIGTTAACANTMYYQKIKKLTKHGIPVTNPEKLEKLKVKETGKERKRKRKLTPEEETLLAECIKNRVRNSNDGISKILNDMTRIFDISMTCMTSRWNGSANVKYPSYKHTLFTEEELQSLLNRKRKMNTTEEQEMEIANYLKRQISENPGNLTQAFRNTQERFGYKDLSSIKNRWYGFYNFKDSVSCRDNMGQVFVTVGNNAVVNGKNQEPTVRKTNWIMNIFRKWINKGKK